MFVCLQTCRLALDDAFRCSERAGTEKSLLSCLKMLIRILMQYPQNSREKEPFEVINQLISHFCEKAIQIRMPDTVVVSLLIKCAFALKHGIVDGRPVKLASFCLFWF